MEVGTLSRWLVKEGGSVASGDLIAEIETDKATMEFEAVDEGVITRFLVKEGTENVKVGTVIALLESEDDAVVPSAEPADAKAVPALPVPAPAKADVAPPAPQAAAPEVPKASTNRIKASPLARRIASANNVDLGTITGTGPGGRIVKADVEKADKAPVAKPAAVTAPDAIPASSAAPGTQALIDERIPHTVTKLSGMRKVIARRLTESMQQAPHIYLTVDIPIDRLLKLRGEINASLAARGQKLSVNDMLVKALGLALIEVPECNVSFAGDELIRYERADISVAVSIAGGLITPIIADANGRSLTGIAAAMDDLAGRAKEGKLAPDEYQGGSASLSNMGMLGIRQFTAVINPPQATILAIGAGELRPYVIDGALGIATVMTVTGSFDHRAVDGADGARLMAAFKRLVEAPLVMLV